MHTNISSQRTSYPSRAAGAKSEHRSSSLKRRNGSPRPRKSYISSPKRHSSLRERSIPRSGREHSTGREHSKHPKKAEKPRSKIVAARRVSSEETCSYSKNNESVDRERGSPKLDSPDLRDDEGDRFQADDEYVVNKPLFRGPEKDILNDRDSLKKIVINMREVPSEVNTIKRQIINPEDITIVRRAGEGSRPIFERDEIINHRKRQEEEEERDRRRSVTTPEHSDFRSREIHYNEEKNQKVRNHRRSRSSPSEYDSWGYEKPREERRSRSKSYERKSHRRYHRSPERTEERSGRRHHRSSPDCRRHEECRNIEDLTDRSMEWREAEQEYAAADRYSEVEYVPINQRYEAEDLEFPVPHSPGRLQSNLRGRRILTNRGFAAAAAAAAPTEVIMCPVPRVRPIRTTFIPRSPAVPVVRFPFPPRVIRPILRPIAPVITPIIRHPYIPLPY